MIQEEALLSVADVAAWLSVSRDWVYDHAARGKQPRLAHIRLGQAVRFRRADIEAFIKLHRLSEEA